MKRQPIDARDGAVHLTRRVDFAASHRLHNPRFTPAKNRAIFGLCWNPHGHGHNYALEVTVIGTPHPDTGMVINLRDLKRILERVILKDCDHKNLNIDVPWLKGINPTAENLAIVFWRRLERRVRPGKLWRVRLFESRDNVVEYFGPSLD